MSSLSQLALLYSDPRTAAALSFGFEREGTRVVCAESAEALSGAVDGGTQLIITGGSSPEEARAKLAVVQGVLMGAGAKVPILYFGNAITREEAFEEGVNEFVSQPAFVRDVVTLAKLMATPMERRTQSISGELSEHFGLFYFVRALGTIEYTGVLSLIRGLRRGELRFYRGEVTSAQIGALHGLAALHHLLLWTHARFDLREEDVVHRRQIPLERRDVIDDCEQFLCEIRSVAGGLSPSAVLERDGEKNTASLPAQVRDVLQLFDGTGSVADVIEDSPYRVFETLRIACRLAEQGYVRLAKKGAPKHLMHTALAIEEWLVGGEVGGEVDEEMAPEESRPMGRAKGQPASPPKSAGKNRQAAGARKRRGQRETWSDLLPSPQSSEDMAQVVPATDAVGEIRSPRAKGSSTATAEAEGNGNGALSASKIFVDESLGSDARDPSAVPEIIDAAGEKTSPASLRAISKTQGDEPDDEPDEDELDEQEDEGAGQEPEEVSSLAASEAPAADGASAAPATAAPATADPAIAEPDGADTEPVAAPYDPAEVARAHERVAQSARDGVAAAAAAAEAGLLKKSPAPESPAPPPESDARKVSDVASAAEEASHEAVHFSADEEAFFNRGLAQAKSPPVASENFDDLDEHYEVPRTFWQRFLSDPDLSRRKKKGGKKQGGKKPGK